MPKVAHFGPLQLARAFGLVLLSSLGGCAGGGPLMHPARTLTPGKVRLTGGMTSQVATGALARALSQDPAKVETKVAAATVAPGVSPLVAARVGLSSRYEAGLTYFGRGVRLDARRSFPVGKWDLSLGLGATAVLSGGDWAGANVPLHQLRGGGVDLPVLFGWESRAGVYHFWAGARAGFEHVIAGGVLASSPTIDTTLVANRLWAGPLLGLAAGLRPVHVAIELSATYQRIWGGYGAEEVSFQGVSLAPSAALWWTF